MKKFILSILMLSSFTVNIKPSFAHKVRLPDPSEFTWKDEYFSGKTYWKAKVTKDEVTWEGDLGSSQSWKDAKKLIFRPFEFYIIRYGKISGRKDFDPNKEETVFRLHLLYVLQEDPLGTTINMTARVEGYTHVIKNEDGSYEFTKENTKKEDSQHQSPVVASPKGE